MICLCLESPQSISQSPREFCPPEVGSGERFSMLRYLGQKPEPLKSTLTHIWDHFDAESDIIYPLRVIPSVQHGEYTCLELRRLLPSFYYFLHFCLDSTRMTAMWR